MSRQNENEEAQALHYVNEYLRESASGYNTKRNAPTPIDSSQLGYIPQEGDDNKINILNMNNWIILE